jgi:putative spermidine/putrescine transport system substrate-binding protein
MRLIDTMTVAENQAKVANLIAYSPTNIEAYKTIEPKLEPWLCTTPENTKKGFIMSQLYWRDHLKDLTERWTAWKLA